MNVGSVLFGVWCVVAFLFTAVIFDSALHLMIDSNVTLQKRPLASNIEYALSLFFLMLLLLWQGIAVDAIRTTVRLRGAIVYRAFIFPVLIASSLMALIPDGLHPPSVLSNVQWIVIALWLLTVGDPTGWTGVFIASSDWFKEKIFRIGSVRNSGIFQGIRGWKGIVVIHLVVTGFFLAGLT